MSRNQEGTSISEKESKNSTINFTYYNPGRTFDGTPYDAAGQAVIQTASVFRLAQIAVHDMEIQVRNAYLQRNLEIDGNPRAEAWEESPEGKLVNSLRLGLEKMQKRLSALHTSATYDPNAPLPPEDE